MSTSSMELIVYTLPFRWANYLSYAYLYTNKKLNAYQGSTMRCLPDSVLGPVGSVAGRVSQRARRAGRYFF